MPIQLTLKFKLDQAGRDVGWSEVIVFNSEEFAAAKTALYDPNGGYVWARLNCLGSGIENTYGKLTKLTNGVPPIGPQKRAVLPVAGVAPTLGLDGETYYNSALAGEISDFSQTVFLLRLQTALGSPPVYVRNFWLSGSPDVAQVVSLDYLTPGPAAAAYARLLTALTAGNLMIYSVDQSGANPVKPCVAYDNTANSFTVFAHGFQSNQKVVATGFRGTHALSIPRGQYRITVIDADHFRLQGVSTSGPFTVLGGFRAVSYVSTAITTATPRGFTNKKHGRPFGLLRGRRSVPKIPRS